MIDIRKKTFFGSKKNFSAYLIRSKNVKFIDFSTNIHISILYWKNREKKSNFFLVNRPPVGLKDVEWIWKTTKIHPFSNIYFHCQDILILVFPQSA